MQTWGLYTEDLAGSVLATEGKKHQEEAQELLAPLLHSKNATFKYFCFSGIRGTGQGKPEVTEPGREGMICQKCHPSLRLPALTTVMLDKTASCCEFCLTAWPDGAVLLHCLHL